MVYSYLCHDNNEVSFFECKFFNGLLVIDGFPFEDDLLGFNWMSLFGFDFLLEVCHLSHPVVTV